MSAPATYAPPPPPGPGVRPPFVAPPTDGTRQRRWWSIGLAAGALVLCCVGGLFGLGGIVVLGNEVVKQQAQAAVTDYLTAIRDGHYDEAYSSRCRDDQERIDQDQFVEFWKQRRLTGFEVEEPVTERNRLIVPAVLHFAGGDSAQERYPVVQDSDSAQFRVCGEAG